MSLSVTCECGKTYKAAETAAGKKIRCKECGAAIPVPKGNGTAKMPAADDDFLNMDLGDQSHEDEPEASVAQAKRRRAGVTSKVSIQELNVAQRFLLYSVQNPWVPIVLFFFGLWVPLPFVLNAEFYLWVDLALIGLCLIGFFVGLVFALIKVSVRNPIEMLTIVAVGGFVGLFVPRDLVAAAGSGLGKTAKALRGGDADGQVVPDMNTGFGGSMAVYCAVIGTAFLLHLVLFLNVYLHKKNNAEKRAEAVEQMMRQNELRKPRDGR